jgi:hypothetical protein
MEIPGFKTFIGLKKRHTITTFLFVCFILVFCLWLKNNSKEIDISIEESTDFKYNPNLLPKIGDKKAEIYEKLGLPNRRWSFPEIMKITTKRESFSFNKYLLYREVKTIELKGDGYTVYESLGDIALAIFLLDDIVQHTIIYHSFRDRKTGQGAIGPLDTGYPEEDKEVRRIKKYYWGLK